MITLIRKFLENVAGIVGDIIFLDWNDQNIFNAKSEGLNSLALSIFRFGGISALSVPATWAAQQNFVYIFISIGKISNISQYVGRVIVQEGGLLVIRIPLCPPLKKGVLF
ncbi:MAG TPA: hypothetical protein PLX69_09960 [Leptospiraceae bacterium]|nr:hypothetical protein [Leptospiraceae bacterium]